VSMRLNASSLNSREYRRRSFIHASIPNGVCAISLSQKWGSFHAILVWERSRFAQRPAFCS
ncbi:MAG: hypothetical protein M3T55_12460, partial [Pseudomonadota bacterium]|nr:hypothetical protein [Pseudomonadota bacterium]